MFLDAYNALLPLEQADSFLLSNSHARVSELEDYCAFSANV